MRDAAAGIVRCSAMNQINAPLSSPFLLGSSDSKAAKAGSGLGMRQLPLRRTYIHPYMAY